MPEFEAASGLNLKQVQIGLNFAVFHCAEVQLLSLSAAAPVVVVFARYSAASIVVEPFAKVADSAVLVAGLVVLVVAATHTKPSTPTSHHHDKGVLYCRRRGRLRLILIQHVNVQYSRHVAGVVAARKPATFHVPFLQTGTLFQPVERIVEIADVAVESHLTCHADSALRSLTQTIVVIFVEWHPDDSVE